MWADKCHNYLEIWCMQEGGDMRRIVGTLLDFLCDQQVAGDNAVVK